MRAQGRNQVCLSWLVHQLRLRLSVGSPRAVKSSHEGKSDRRRAWPGDREGKRGAPTVGRLHPCRGSGGKGRDRSARAGAVAKGIGDVISPVSEGLEGEIESGMLSRQGAHLTSAGRPWTTSSTAQGRAPDGLAGVAEVLHRY